MITPDSTSTILVVDDDADVRATVGRTLERDGYQVLEAPNGETALRLARQARPDVIILDIMLSDISGYDLCMKLRALPIVNHTPILFLSVHHSAQHVAQALDSGGDDYLRKPFAPRELSARIRALLRRSVLRTSTSTNVLQLDPNIGQATLNGNPIPLTPTEFALLEYLCANPTLHHTANTLLENLWHYPPGKGDTALVRNHIRNLRRKLEDDPDHPTIVVSLHGRGYSIDAEVIYTSLENVPHVVRD